jgi:hypothetical protein
MLILGAWLISILVLIVIFIFWREKLTWWEAGILLVSPLLFIILARAFIERIQVTDTEYWGGWAVVAEYYEDWDERVSCRHPIPCSHTCYSGSGNNRTSYPCHSNDGYYHAYDVDYHPPYWQLIDSNRETFSIDQSSFEELATRWHNRQFVDLHRSYHSKDGDKYTAAWDNQIETIEATTSKHSYENRVAVSDSIFRFPEVDPKHRVGLFDYPELNSYRQSMLLGYKGPGAAAAQRKLEILNATKGKSKQLRVYIIIFRNKTLDAAKIQQALWQGGNKNEFNVVIGLDDAGNIQWAYPFSWTKKEILKIDVRGYLDERRGQPLDLPAFIDYLGTELDQNWVRRPFAEWADLAVNPPTWAVVTTYILTLIICLFIGWWCVTNDHDNDSDSSSDFRPSPPPDGPPGSSWGQGLFAEALERKRRGSRVTKSRLPLGLGKGRKRN